MILTLMIEQNLLTNQDDNILQYCVLTNTMLIIITITIQQAILIKQQ